jgi:Outer membrane protein beta-barrel domain
MKNVFFALILSFSAISLQAQQTLSFGPIVGANFSKISDIDNSEFNTGLAVGGQLTYSNENNWGLGVGVLYSREGVDVTSGLLEGETNLTYLRIPLKGYLFFRDNEDRFRPKLFLGPSIGILLDGDSKLGGNEFDVKDNFNTLDLGLMMGVGFNARLSESGTWLNFDLGYTHGLLNVAENGADGTNRGICATVGFLFGI